MKGEKIPLVLFAEDDDDDWLLMEDFLDHECRASLHYERVTDGVHLLARLRDLTLPLPHMVMLDLKMPRMDGFEAMDEMMKDPKLKPIPIVVMTTSNTETDVVKSYTLGANSYIVKPVKSSEMTRVLKSVYEHWRYVARLPRGEPVSGSSCATSE